MPDWFMGWARTITLFDVLLWVAGLVAVVAFIKKGWPSLKAFATALLHFVQIVDAVQGLPDFIIRTDDTLARQDVEDTGHFSRDPQERRLKHQGLTGPHRSNHQERCAARPVHVGDRER